VVLRVLGSRGCGKGDCTNDGNAVSVSCCPLTREGRCSYLESTATVEARPGAKRLSWNQEKKNKLADLYDRYATTTTLITRVCIACKDQLLLETIHLTREDADDCFATNCSSSRRLVTHSSRVSMIRYVDIMLCADPDLVARLSTSYKLDYNYLN
jgi:hypothetical protein